MYSNIILDMSLPSFFVGRSLTTCTSLQVKDIFISRLGEDVVDKVLFSEKVDSTGIIYNTFWVTLKKSTAVVEKMVEEIKRERYIIMFYDDDCHYFRVALYNQPKPLFNGYW